MKTAILPDSALKRKGWVHCPVFGMNGAAGPFAAPIADPPQASAIAHTAPVHPFLILAMLF
jgi:hypothetical protein